MRKTLLQKTMGIVLVTALVATSAISVIAILQETDTATKEGNLVFIDPENSSAITGIDIEFAQTDEEISRGLMNRESMPEDYGMLFVYDTSEQRSFWMKDTEIPLDIVFIDENFNISNIQGHTEPLSQTPIPSVEPARYVLEVNAGFADEWGIKKGDIVQFTSSK
ncbi:MAG: DUF192 domain-containing protein [Candidatus Peregrinibacteria bacterium]